MTTTPQNPNSVPMSAATTAPTTKPNDSTNPSSAQDKQSKQAKQSNLKPKLAVAGLVFFASTGVAGYFAYQHGFINPYLPELIQKGNPINSSLDTQANPAPTPSNPSNPSAHSAISVDNSTANREIKIESGPSTPQNANNLNSSSTTPENTQATNAIATSSNATTQANQTAQLSAATPNNSDQQAVLIATKTQVLVEQNNATTARLLGIIDAQNQWQTVQYTFLQNWNTALALQTTQALKAQLQALNDSSVLPSISALTQSETQIQAWHQLTPQTHLDTLQQAINDLPKLTLRTKQTPTTVPQEEGIWAKFTATLKSLFSVRHINTAQTETTLDNANAAIVKQGIHANLLTAQWSARNGQWASAQEQIRQAHESIQKYGQGYTLDALKPLMDITQFPVLPDFTTPSASLAQARAHLTQNLTVARQNGSTQANGRTSTNATDNTNKP